MTVQAGNANGPSQTQHRQPAHRSFPLRAGKPPRVRARPWHGVGKTGKDTRKGKSKARSLFNLPNLLSWPLHDRGLQRGGSGSGEPHLDPSNNTPGTACPERPDRRAPARQFPRWPDRIACVPERLLGTSRRQAGSGASSTCSTAGRPGCAAAGSVLTSRSSDCGRSVLALDLLTPRPGRGRRRYVGHSAAYRPLTAGR